MEREIMTRIAEKYQITVPPEFRDLYDLHVGDLFHWRYDAESEEIRLTPKRAQLITPQIRDTVRSRKQAWIEKRKRQAAIAAKPSTREEKAAAS